jgi:hypothetical protein
LDSGQDLVHGDPAALDAVDDHRDLHARSIILVRLLASGAWLCVNLDPPIDKVDDPVNRDTAGCIHRELFAQVNRE